MYARCCVGFHTHCYLPLPMFNFPHPHTIILPASNTIIKVIACCCCCCSILQITRISDLRDIYNIYRCALYFINFSWMENPETGGFSNPRTVKEVNANDLCGWCCFYHFLLIVIVLFLVYRSTDQSKLLNYSACFRNDVNDRQSALPVVIVVIGFSSRNAQL